MASDPYRMQLTAQSERTLRNLQRCDAMPELRVALKLAAKPMVADAKDAARNLPSKRKRVGAASGSLRSAVANSIISKIRFTKRDAVVLIKAVPRGGKSNLSRLVEGEIPWEHPTYGHKPEDTQAATPFFYKAMEKHAPLVERIIRDVLVKFERKL
jgi:hypothetical protein